MKLLTDVTATTAEILRGIEGARLDAIELSDHRRAKLLLNARQFIFDAEATCDGCRIVYGVVWDDDGSPIPGATVTMTNAAGEMRTVETDVDGSYRFPKEKPGSYSVKAEEAGRISEVMSVVF